jgi:putative transcription factor
LRCEVCGSKIYGRPYKVIIEGAKLTVCSECAKHGRVVIEEPKPRAVMLKPKAALPSFRVQSNKPLKTTVETTQELVENFDLKIRQAREKLELSHEELGKKINEKVSVLRKIETKKVKPNNILVTKLERALKIKLLVPSSDEKIQQTKVPKAISRELTLGDIIQLNKKDRGKEEPTERKPS